MCDSIKIEFLGEGLTKDKVRFKVTPDCPPEAITMAAAALMDIAARFSPDGYEKEIEEITKRAMETNILRIT